MKRTSVEARRASSAPSRTPEPIPVEITAIAAGGEGVGHLPDGRVIFVHRTAPGELVEAGILEERKRWARGALLRVVRPSPDRRAEVCPHYERCGGCTIEHLEYPAQLAAKARIVRDALTRIGGVDIGIPHVVASPREFRYRNRVSFALRRLGGGRVVAGFHALHEPGHVLDIDGSCLLPEEAVARVWRTLRQEWGRNADRLPSGERLRLTLRATSAGRVSLLVEGGSSPGRPEELIERIEGLDAIAYRDADGTARNVAGAAGLAETWGVETFTVAGAAFLQVNRDAAVLLEDHVISLAADVAGLRVVDAYSGIGLHARRLARAGARVTGIERDPAAVRIAEAQAVEGSSFRCGTVEGLLGTTLPADLLILNPPRVGLHPSVVEQILGAAPPRIIYISCDPATLARDVKRLGSMYEIASIRCFDLFPQTTH
ncbi:MAG TPA: TRAM domain-containing protein, partial [Longimicrobiaceae bacterium]|nr:TRAM domain-containing protein [Longimicrobiaceae bacterium]